MRTASLVRRSGGAYHKVAHRAQNTAMLTTWPTGPAARTLARELPADKPR